MTTRVQYRAACLRLTWILLAGSFFSPLFLAASKAQGSVRWTTNFYSVTGTTIPELRQSIREKRPWKERSPHDATTEWRLNWQYTVTPTASGCRCSSFTTQTAITITMPRWAAPTNAPETTRTIWREYITALGRHEVGHGAIAVAAAAELDKRVQALGEAAECDELKRKIEALCPRVIEEFRARDKAYDETTRHGATQGAVLPGSRGRQVRP